jgi:hypothetical protein
MGIRIIIIVFLLVVVSCTKPTQEASSPDSTATTQSSSNSSDNRVPATLTAQEMERVHDELFLAFHKGLMYQGVALKEEIAIDGNRFRYTLMRHNVDEVGLTASPYTGITPPTEEQEQAWEADTTKDKEPLQGEAYTQTNYHFVSEIDTFYVVGDFKAFVTNPESTPRALTIEFGGDGLIHQNANNVGSDGVPVFVRLTWGYFNPNEGLSLLDDEYLYVNLEEPLAFKKDELYLKAKIKDLTDADLAGLTKDELAFVRNDIFARHGHTFKTSKMITRYQAADWYHPVVADAGPLLNKFEKRNVDFIKAKEG